MREWGADECEHVSVSPAHLGSGGTDLTPLGISGGTGGLEVLSTRETALLIETIADRGMAEANFCTAILRGDGI